ncbi:MAG: sugar phosphate isomerase/epimerase [Phycisphaerales bacterium]|nr:sugar phosphate isomerase/epimerase [Phycisphaerales bacterium]
MLLTLTATSVRSLLGNSLSLEDLPAYTRQSLGLHGINLSTDLLRGVGATTLKEIRERADKAACACLLLIESDPLPFADEDDEIALQAVERMQKVIKAAWMLGCNAAAVRIEGEDSDLAFEYADERLKPAVETAEEFELNLLVSPTAGLTESPDRVTELIKKIGGFRVGTFPDFETASRTKDPVAYMRRLTPYASIVSASTIAFEGGDDWDPTSVEDPGHATYDLAPLVGAVMSVGFDGTLAIDYRGEGDGTLGVLRSRSALESAIERIGEGE